MTTLELVEVTHAGGERRGAELADSGDPGSALRRGARAHVVAHLAVAPAHVLVELSPVIKRTLQHAAAP